MRTGERLAREDSALRAGPMASSWSPTTLTQRQPEPRFKWRLASLLVAAAAIYTGHQGLLPFVAAAMLWGHYWDASNCMTIPTMVARPEYRGTASGFAYVFVKVPSFLAIFLFPALFTAIGQPPPRSLWRSFL
jgi:hypothetical protein